MPVINGVYLKDFTALPSSVTDANIIPIAITGNQIAYRTTVGGIVTDARVTSKLLTGLSVTGGAVVATDTILQAFGKVQNQINSKVSSVGLTMPSAFSVANSPITSAGTLAVTAIGAASQYIRGDGALADFPTSGGGGSSVSYYLNGSVSQGTFVGNTYYEMNKTPVIGTGTDFTINANGYIAQFITDANDPASLLIPAGNWNVEMYFSASSSGGTPSFYVEVYKYNGTTFTLLGSSATTPEGITNGTAIDIYYTSVGIPETVLTITDRLAIRIYVTHSGRTITLHTEDNHLSEIVTTFSNGLTALNGLTKQAQYFAVGSTGTDFNIASSVDTHTFNIPDASASARGLITTGTQTIAGAKTLTGALIGTTGSFSSSGSSDSFAINHSSGAGIALNITKGGNGEGIYVNKTSGSGNAVTIIGTLNATTLVKSGGTSAQFLKADGTVDSTTYQGAITLTTTGTSGAATLVGSTLNVPNYADGGVLSLSAIGATPNANAATITGTVLNLQPADASFGGVITTGTQTFAGAKTFSSDAVVNGLTVGRGSGNISTNTVVGNATLQANTTGGNNVAIGQNTLVSNTEGAGNISVGSFSLRNNTLGTLNTAIGLNALYSNTTGVDNTATGYQSLYYNTTGGSNTASGMNALFNNTTGSNNTALGNGTGGGITTGSGNTILGAQVGGLAAALTNNIILASGTGSIKAQHDGTNWTFTGGATITGVLTLNSTITNGTYTYTLPSATGTLALTSDLSGYLPLTGGTLTGALSGTSATFSGKITQTNASQPQFWQTYTGTGAWTAEITNYNDTWNFYDVTGVASLLNYTRSTGTWLFPKTTASSSTTTGALVVSGGVGIGGALSGTSATFSGKIAFSANSGATASGQIGRDATYGMFQWASTGSTDDWTVFSPSLGYIMHVPTGTVNTVFGGSISGTSATFSGAVSKGSGSFRIEHPLPSLSKTHQLVHSFIEGPQADLIYRGKLTLVNGKAQANIDEVSTMTEGTFEALCREIQCFTTNESGWDLIKGKVIGNIIYIESQNENSTDEISWMVIGERKDKHMMETEWTDENGKVIVEPLKPIEPIVEVTTQIEPESESIIPTDNNLE